jgi:hypothetical protein
MSDLSVKLTMDERDFLVGLLQRTQKNALVEEHRTRTPTYREQVLHKEELITTLLKKLNQPCESSV